jgi:hypothetical protein
MLNLVFITTQPLHNNSLKKFDFEWYEKQGIKTYLFDLSPIIYTIDINNAINSINKDNHNTGIMFTNKTNFSDISSFNSSVRNLSNNSLFFLMTKTLSNTMSLQDEILTILNDSQCKYVLQDSVNPEVYNLHRLYRYRIKEIIKHHLGVYRKYNKDLIPKFIFGSGLKTKLKYSKIFNEGCKFIDIKSLWINSDVDRQNSNDNYSVFIEESVLSSPDAVLLNSGSCVDNSDDYFNYINELFSLIEKNTGVKIIISASGKHVYEVNPFAEREIIYGNTFDLIPDSIFVICHNSISILQAIYHMKPVLFIDYKYKPSSKRAIIKSYSDMLARQIINYPYTTDHIKYGELFELSDKSKTLYERFIIDYLQTDHNSVDMKDALLTELKSSN